MESIVAGRRIINRRKGVQVTLVADQGMALIVVQIANALAVNDPDAQDAARLALGQIIGHEVFHVARLKRMQIKHAVDWKLDGFVFHVREFYQL